MNAMDLESDDFVKIAAKKYDIEYLESPSNEKYIVPYNDIAFLNLGKKHAAFLTSTHSLIVSPLDNEGLKKVFAAQQEINAILPDEEQLTTLIFTKEKELDDLFKKDFSVYLTGNGKESNSYIFRLTTPSLLY